MRNHYHPMVETPNANRGLPTTAWFEWGATTNYTNRTPAIPLGTTNTDLPVSYRFCALPANTNYHARLVATNMDGSTAGNDLLFSTGSGNLAQNPGFEQGTNGGAVSVPPFFHIRKLLQL
jgi:hypothetical protein